MYIAFGVGFRVVRIENKHMVKLLGALGAVFEHDAHGRITVDIGVLALDITVTRVGISNLAEGLHQARVHLTAAAALIPVENIRLCRGDVPVIHKDLFDNILDMLNIGHLGSLDLKYG